MKKMAMLSCAAALTVCGSLHPQVPVDTVNVRFASPVIVGAKTLPAGECDDPYRARQQQRGARDARGERRNQQHSRESSV